MIDAITHQNVRTVIRTVTRTVTRGDASRPDDERSTAFADRNSELFARRRDLLGRVAQLIDSGPGDGEIAETVHRRRHARLRQELDEVTAEIVSFNLGLVRSYCRRFTAKASRDDAADFEAAGLLGLMRAIDSFDPQQGRFGQWAFKPIQREVLRAVRDADHPNVNLGDFERRPDILRAAEAVRADRSCVAPPFAEVAELAGVSIEQVRRVLVPPRIESADAGVGRHRGDGGESLAETVESGDPGPDAVVLAQMVLAALHTHGLGALEARERMVVTRRFGLDGRPPEKLSTVGDVLGLSREAVRQIEAKALAKVQHPLVLRWINGSGAGRSTRRPVRSSVGAGIDAPIDPERSLG